MVINVFILNVLFIPTFPSIDWPNSEFLLPESKLERSILHYRAVYIIIQMFNQAIGKLFIPYFKLLLILAFIIGVFAVIRLRSQLDLLSIAVLSSGAILAFAFVVPIAFIMSALFTTSNQFKRNLNSIVQGLGGLQDVRKYKYFHGQLNACALIRCTVGNLYHMEAMAKLTMIDRSVNGVVFLLVKVKA